ncbi:putative HTH-type transcriptional activator RhaS [Hollandina sp. SP2]
MEHDKEAAKRNIDALKAKLSALVQKPGDFPTAIEGLYLYRQEMNVRKDCFHDPVVGVIVQGDKRALVADEEYRFREGWYIAYGLDLPAISHITGASAKKPHLALSIPLDRYILSQLAAEVKPRPGGKAYKGLTAAEARPDMLEACLRLLNLLDTPERIPVIAPMIMREIHYYLLAGPEGEDFRLLGTAENPNNQIARAVSWLREHYRELFSLAELAAQVNMSQPSLCRHFSRITGTSPLQFQKRLRLYEAQRLMLTEDKSAETVAYEVGYDSPTQFNREYKRQFGEPPRRDIQKLLTAGAVAGDEMGAASLTGA